jgi:mono/diheme cytochrome c family protein
MSTRVSGYLLAAALQAGLLATAVCAQIAQTPVDGVDLFDTQVRPVLERSCFKCHGEDPERLKSGLELTTRAGLLRGGSRGPALDTASPDGSLLLEAIAYENDQLEMPPAGRMSDEEIAAIRQWVQVGAPYGGDQDELTAVAAEGAFTITDEDREWWSVRPLARPPAPHVRDRDWVGNEIDHFILARLEAAGLEPAAEADRRALIRRATYDLTGLPPTAAEVAAFQADERPDAWERLIDRLLSSPHYGEKWGRHWLDLVRFAETDGYERDRLKPGAWRYRDWVIDAFNSDVPYDDFLLHQLAGDEIETPTAASIIATGYLRLGIWDDEPTDTALAQYDDLDSILDTTSRVMLGMSMGCARCHDHRGDPIPQRDYYRMLSFFRGIAPYKVGGGNQPTPEHYVDRIPADLGSPEAGRAEERWRAERQRLVAELKRLEAEATREVGAERFAAATAERDRGLVAHLAFEEEAALVAQDGEGRFHGRVEDAAVGIEGVLGRAYGFDGENDSVRIERPVTDDFTISLWFRSSALAPGGVERRWYLGAGLVDGNVEGDVDDFGLALVGDGYVTAGVGNPTVFLSSDPGYNDGEWHHVAFTRERATGALVLYVDGEVVDEALGSSEALDAPAFLEVGRLLAGHGHFEGELDDLRFYDRLLSAREVLDVQLGGGVAEPFADLVAEWGKKHAERHARVVDELLALEHPRRDYLDVLRVKELGPEAPPTHVLIRGNPHAPAQAVEPGFPEILDPQAPALPMRGPEAGTSGRRLALARWIASDDNIRTSRVMANRLWQYHFGRGLVPTPNDFGHFGREPTHPELLDWLAAELVDRGWSLKSMHRLIMTSSAYRMSSRGEADALSKDPENNLIARFDMRRLAAEEIRDSILAASGTLNLELGGPGVYPTLPEEVLATASRPDEAWGDSTPEQAARRSVYIHVKRSLLHPLLDTLDLADTDATCPVRFVTTQPTQALTMLNSDFMNDQASLLAKRAREEAPGTLDASVARALQIVLGRGPRPDEVAGGVSLVRELEVEEGFAPDDAFTGYCLVLLNLNEFVYLD